MQIKKYILPVLLVLVTGTVLSACEYDSANVKEQNNVQDQQKIYVDNQPAPFFDWSMERHVMIELYKARNNSVLTYSYVRNLNGQVIFQCKSIGFPLPSNMQLTNSEALANPSNSGYPSSQATALPQAEPNGLYSSPSTSGTYVMCLNSDGTVSPSYFEANVETHLSPLNGDTLSGNSVLKIKITK